MISENIKNARKAKGISQEEMALKLNVVRQTVSKWEKGLSVPDADVLIQIAELLEVPVHTLLGITPQEDRAEDLAKELERLNQELALKTQEHRLFMEANKKRGFILLLSFLAMLTAMSVKNELLSLVLVSGCVLAALIILYRNLALLTKVTTNDLRIGVLKATTIFNGTILAAVAVIVGMEKTALIQMSETQDKLLALGIVSAIILFGGFISPKLPFNRHTGLRLPWTVQDEDTWNVAHKLIGIISLPLWLLYLALTFTLRDFETVTLVIVALWIGIPGIFSFIFWRRKFRRKL